MSITLKNKLIFVPIISRYLSFQNKSVTLSVYLEEVNPFQLGSYLLVSGQSSVSEVKSALMYQLLAL